VECHAFLVLDRDVRGWRRFPLLILRDDDEEEEEEDDEDDEDKDSA
jgi:hypothetical protein